MGDARFSAFWVGQAISMFGDRLHQIALGFLVFDATDSPLATGFVFLAATLPNLVLGPIAGTFVDRWDYKRVMIVSDLLRAVLVLLIPVVARIDILLVYPVVFLVTTVSLFFRPARVAVVPRIVAPDDLLAANSALPGVGCSRLWILVTISWGAPSAREATGSGAESPGSRASESVPTVRLLANASEFLRIRLPPASEPSRLPGPAISKAAGAAVPSSKRFSVRSRSP